MNTKGKVQWRSITPEDRANIQKIRERIIKEDEKLCKRYRAIKYLEDRMSPESFELEATKCAYRRAILLYLGEMYEYLLGNVDSIAPKFFELVEFWGEHLKELGIMPIEKWQIELINEKIIMDDLFYEKYFSIINGGQA